jgi:hypothetical protein
MLQQTFQPKIGDTILLYGHIIVNPVSKVFPNHFVCPKWKKVTWLYMVHQERYVGLMGAFNHGK